MNTHRLNPMAIFLFLVFLLIPACQTVPVTERSQLVLLSKDEAAQMGEKTFEEILKKEKVSTDPELNAMVQRLGRRITAAAGVQDDYKWEFKVIENDKTANAFALPGGKVAVYTGILPITKTEAGLAAIMGHEVAHVTARHGSERVSQQLLVQTGLSAVMAALTTGDSQTTQQVASLLGAGATVGVMLPFSRKHESEADHLGLIYMAKAGYDPREARELWVRMAERSKGQRPPEFLSTHPAPETRIQQIEEWLPEAIPHYEKQRNQSDMFIPGSQTAFVMVFPVPF